MTTLPIRRLSLVDESASAALGSALAALAIAGFGEAVMPGFDGFTIHFSGDLGTGKTTIARALLRRLGVTGRIKSPTYTLVESYVVETAKSVESRRNMKLNCYHFDFYRFEDPHDWLDAGFRDYFSDVALRLVEWPERARADDGTSLPPPDLHVVLEHRANEAADARHTAQGGAGHGRIALLSAATPRGAAWLNAASATPAWSALVDASSRAG